MVSSQTTSSAPRFRQTTGSGVLRRIQPSRAGIFAMLPATPLMFFLCLTLLAPLGIIVKTAFRDAEISSALPMTTEALARWTGENVPGEEMFVTLAQDLANARETGMLRPLSRRMGYELVRGSKVVTNGARAVPDEPATVEPVDLRAAFLASDPAWGQTGVWTIIKQNSASYSLFYIRWALGFDVMISADGGFIGNRGYDFRAIYIRTVAISLLVTGLTVLIGYPMAYVVSSASGRAGKFLIFLVLLPFWTSLLVRTMSWIVVLQRNGVLNDMLLFSGAVSEPPSLLYTRFATIVAMVQIQLPFTVLPMITVMRAIPPSHVRAARSLGASPLRAHMNVFLPQAVPGIAAGALLTFILCLGFYITPALVGGAGDQMVSFFIARFTNEELNWGLASALSLVLVAGAVAIALPLSRYVSRHSSGRF